MKYIALFLFSFILVFSSKGQDHFTRIYTPIQWSKGKFDTLHIPYGPLTMSTDRSPGEIRVNSVDKILYWWTGTEWRSTGGTGSSDGLLPNKPDSVTLSPGRGVDTLKNWYSGAYVIQGYVDKQGGLISGGNVTYSGNGLTFNVSPAVYYINWVRTNSAAGSITLPGADIHFNRIDAIGLDKSGHIVVIPGTAAVNPITPQVDPTQAIYLTSILVRAGDSTPSSVKVIKVYDENVPSEWSVSATGLSFDANNTLAPQHLLRDISTNSWTDGSKLIFTGANTASISDYNLLQFYLNNKVLGSANSSITVTFFNNNIQVSSPTQVNYDKTQVGTYQAVTLPLSTVSFTGTTFNSIVLNFNGNNASGVFIDNVQLQGGVTVNITSTGVTTFNLRNGNVVPLPGDYKVSDITGLLDSLGAKQPLFFTGDSLQYLGGDGLPHKILIPTRDSVTFNRDFRNLGNKGYPIISLNPNGTNVGTFTNATVSVDSTGRVTGISSGTGGSGGSVSQVNSDWNATTGFAQILNKPVIPAPIDTSLMHNEIVQNTNAITNLGNRIGANSILPNGIISGGYISWSGTGLIYNVTPAVYRINNKIYTSASSTFTLGAADNLYNRIDQVIVDTLGAVSIITGTPSANPATPQLNPASQLSLTTITVTAGSTTPANIFTTTIYDEHTEWNASGFGVAPNFENTTNVAHLFRATSIPSWTDGNAILYSNGTGGGSTISINNYSALTMYVRLDAPVSASANVSVAFMNDQSQMCGAVTLTNSLGFDKTIIGVYQPVTIPISSFYFNNGYLINTLKFFLSGSNATGLSIDFIQLQAGATQGTSNFLTDVSLHGVDSVGQTKNGIWNYRFRLPSNGGTGTVTSVNGISPVSGNVTVPFPAQFNPIAGTGMTISGTYPNVTFNSTATGGGTVTNVTGTAPIIITGTATAPNVTADTSKQVGRLATYSDLSAKLNIADAVSYNITNVRDNDLLKYDSINHRFVNFRTQFLAPLSWNYSQGIASVDTTVLATRAYVTNNAGAGGGGTSQWVTSGTTINYPTGNVGIKSLNPTAPLQITGSGSGNSGGNSWNNPIAKLYSTATKGLQLGVNDAGNYGYIGAAEENVAWLNIGLGLGGEKIGIGTSTFTNKVNISGVLGITSTPSAIKINDVSTLGANATIAINTNDGVNTLGMVLPSLGIESYVNNRSAPTGGAASTNGAVLGFNLGTVSNHDMSLATNNTSRIRLTKTGQVNIGLIANDPTTSSSILSVSSTSQGILPPRMTSANRDLISTPVAGLTLYCTDCIATDASTGVMQTYNGSVWKNNW